MKGINHLVLAGHDLDALRSAYQALGFTVLARSQHPFGTGNAVIQLHGSYLELLSVTRPQDVPDHGPDRFSFAAFNRDYLARHEGFSMLVLDTQDAAADIAAWKAAGLCTYEPFEFSRMAKMADGDEVKVGFSLAFVSHPAAPWLGIFACQHFAPAFFAQPAYQTHVNTGQAVRDVWITGGGARELAGFLRIVTGAEGVPDAYGRIVFRTANGDIIIANDKVFEAAFGTPPPHAEDGPCLAGLTIGCSSLDPLADMNLESVGERLVLPPARGFGTAVAFSAVSE